MATIRKIYVGDIGTVIIIDMGANISGATNIKFIVNKPDASNPGQNTEVEWVAIISGTSAFKYNIQIDDLDIDGYYEIRPEFSLGTWSGSGNKVGFPVEPK